MTSFRSLSPWLKTMSPRTKYKIITPLYIKKKKKQVDNLEICLFFSEQSYNMYIGN